MQGLPLQGVLRADGVELRIEDWTRDWIAIFKLHRVHSRANFKESEVGVFQRGRRGRLAVCESGCHDEEGDSLFHCFPSALSIQISTACAHL